MTVNDIGDGHSTADDDAVVVMPVLNRIVISNVSTVCVMHIDHLSVSCLTQCCYVDLVCALHVIPEIKKKHKIIN